MSEITELRQGSLTEQYVVRTEEGGQRRKHGPYYIRTWYIDGEKHTEHVPGSEAGEMQALIRNYQKMKDLFAELLDLTEQLTLSAPPQSARQQTRPPARRNKPPQRRPRRR